MKQIVYVPPEAKFTATSLLSINYDVSDVLTPKNIVSIESLITDAKQIACTIGTIVETSVV